jgi:hypothetical protein
MATQEQVREWQEKQMQKLREILYKTRNNYTSTIKPIFADSLSELNDKTIEERRKQLNPTYDEVIAIGFKREEARDDVFENKHGYPYFLVNFEAQNFIIEWDIETHQLRIFVCGVPIEYISLEKATRIIYEFRNRNK